MPAAEGLERFEDYAISVDTSGTRHIAFTVKVILGETILPEPSGLWLYVIEGADSTADTTTDFGEGETFLSGEVKWDGCSNWDFHTAEIHAHFCDRAQATGIGRLMDHLYQITKERLPTYIRDR